MSAFALGRREEHQGTNRGETGSLAVVGLAVAETGARSARCEEERTETKAERRTAATGRPRERTKEEGGQHLSATLG